VGQGARLPSLDGLLAFEATARLGSFERAADELHLTGGAIGKRVAVLEELLGMALFVRGARALQLTPDGRDYLAQVAPILAQLAALPQHRPRAGGVQRLRVSVPPTFARQILVPRLESFTREHPGVELELQLALPHLDLAGSGADIEVRFGDARRGLLLLDEPVLPVLAPTLRATLGGLAAPSDLARAPLLRSPLEPWTPWFRAAGLPWPEPATGQRLSDLGLLLEAAVAGQGVALARPTLAQGWLRNGALVAPWRVTAAPLHRYYLHEHAPQGPAALFARWLQALCQTVRAEALDAVSALA
jgi:LysR family transcriptional regulator, glycine cleavage system transcriptional activator